MKELEVKVVSNGTNCKYGRVLDVNRKHDWRHPDASFSSGSLKIGLGQSLIEMIHSKGNSIFNIGSNIPSLVVKSYPTTPCETQPHQPVGFTAPIFHCPFQSHTTCRVQSCTQIISSVSSIPEPYQLLHQPHSPRTNALCDRLSGGYGPSHPSGKVAGHRSDWE